MRCDLELIVIGLIVPIEKKNNINLDEALNAGKECQIKEQRNSGEHKFWSHVRHTGTVSLTEQKKTCGMFNHLSYI